MSKDPQHHLMWWTALLGKYEWEYQARPNPWPKSWPRPQPQVKPRVALPPQGRAGPLDLSLPAAEAMPAAAVVAWAPDDALLGAPPGTSAAPPTAANDESDEDGETAVSDATDLLQLRPRNTWTASGSCSAEAGLRSPRVLGSQDLFPAQTFHY